MEENQKKSFDFAADTTKQLITLSTAIITLSVTFAKDIIGLNDYPKDLLAWTWGVFIASLCFGIFTLMALTGSLQPIKKKDKNKTQEEIAAEEKEKTEITKAQEKTVEEAASKGIIVLVPPENNFSINNGNIRLFSIFQILFFITGIIMTVVFGYKLISINTKSDDKKEYMIIRESKLGIDTTRYIDTLYLPKK